MRSVAVHSLRRFEELVGTRDLDFYLGSFSCPQNAEVEEFLKRKALQSSRLSASVTYLVCGEADKELLGYFTLSVKSYSVAGKSLNSRNRRLVGRFSESDENGCFHAPVYLIAQIGKNFALPADLRIPGRELLALALNRISIAKDSVGGKLVMVEREIDRPKLRDFYAGNGFRSWTTRLNARDGIAYDQMFAVLGDSRI